MLIGDLRNVEILKGRARIFFTDLLKRDKLIRLLNRVNSSSRNYGSEESRGSEDSRIFSNAALPSALIPEPRRTRISGLLGSIVSLVNSNRATRLHEHVDEMHKMLGPIYRDRVGPVKAIFVNSPDDFQKIFRSEGSTPMHFLPEAWKLYNEMRHCPRGILFMDGEEWLHFRRIINRTMLLPDPTSVMAKPCEEAARDLVEGWKLFADTGDAIPQLETTLYRWSIEVMLATLIGSSWHTYKSRIAKETQHLTRNLHRIFVLSSKLSLLPAEYAMKLRLPVWREFCNVADESLDTVRSIILGMVGLESNGLLALMNKEGITNELDLVRLVTDLVIAAGDTTAFSTQWLLFLLAKNLSTQRKLYERIKEMNEKEILADAFIKAIVKESMRLYPIAPFLTRFMPEDSVIAGYQVPKEELIIMSVYSSSRDPQNFQQPNDFLPERWMRNERGAYERVINPYGSLPFALGARSCVGRKLAETQMILTLSEIVKNFRIECPNAERVKMILHMISVPSEPIQLKLRKR